MMPQMRVQLYETPFPWTFLALQRKRTQHAAWTLCRIKNTEQCLVEIVSVAFCRATRWGMGGEVCDPGMACVTYLPLVVEVQEARHGMQMRREQIKSERMRARAAVHGSGA